VLSLHARSGIVTLPSGRTYGYLMELKEVILDMKASTTGKTIVGSDQTAKRYGLGPGHMCVCVRCPESMPPELKLMDTFGHDWVRGKSRRFSFDARLGEKQALAGASSFMESARATRPHTSIRVGADEKLWRLYYDPQGLRSDNDSVQQANRSF
jgi:hypothetical protein